MPPLMDPRSYGQGMPMIPHMDNLQQMDKGQLEGLLL